MPYITPNAPVIGTTCRRLIIPDHPLIVAAINGALTELLFPWNWAPALGEGSMTPNDVVAMLQPHIYAFFEDACAGDCDCGNMCTSYPATSGFLIYDPSNPITDPETIPPGFIAPPFFVADSEILSPYQAGDIITDVTRFPGRQNIGDIVTVGLPRFRVPVLSTVNDAVVELHLLAVPLGGYALVTRDNDPATIKLVDTNSFSFADIFNIGELFNLVLEGDLVTERIIEVVLPDPGEHFVDVTFFPNVSAEDIIGFGGGLRRLELCGAIPQGEEPMPTFTPEFQVTGCVLQWRTDSEATWEDLVDLSTCTIPGEQGIQGEPGEPGEPGNPGADGVCEDCGDNSPPPTIGDEAVACGIAQYMVQWHDAIFEDFIDLVDSATSLAQLIGDFLPITFGIGISAATLMQAAIDALTTTTTALRSDVTSEKLEEYTCNLYCALKDEGTFSKAKFDEWIASEQATATAVGQHVWLMTMSAYNTSELMRRSTVGAAAPSAQCATLCEECDETCTLVSFAENGQDWIGKDSNVIWSGGAWIADTHVSKDNVWIAKVLPAGTIVSVKVYATNTGVSSRLFVGKNAIGSIVDTGQKTVYSATLATPLVMDGTTDQLNLGLDYIPGSSGTHPQRVTAVEYCYA